jgi:hypothetical protein
VVDLVRFERCIEAYIALWGHVVKIEHPEARMSWIGSGFEDLSPLHLFSVADFSAGELCKATTMMSRLHRYVPLNGDHRVLWLWSAFVGGPAAEPILGGEWIGTFQQVSLLIWDVKPALQIGRIIEPLMYALLEGGLRRVMPNLIELDGILKREIRTSFGKHSAGSRLNNVGALLELFLEEGSSHARSALAVVVRHMRDQFSPSETIEKMIYRWRCELLHGEEFLRDRMRYLFDMVTVITLAHADEARYHLVRTSMDGLPALATSLAKVSLVVPMPASNVLVDGMEQKIAEARARLRTDA